MATFAQHSDQKQQHRSSGQRPIVLARLPRLGASAPDSDAPPTPEPMPQLDLQTEIHQQLRIHTAHPPLEGSAHAPEQELPEQEPALAPQQEPALAEEALLPKIRIASDSFSSTPSETLPPRTETAAPSSLSSLSEKIFQLHSQLAPLAGLIVAMALIASAGLLYWMIVGGSNVPAYAPPHYGQELGSDGLGTAHVPEFSQPSTIDPPTHAWTEVPLPSPSLRSTQIAQPQAETPAFEQTPVAEELHFPSTTHPHQLDFTQKGPTLPSEPTANAPQALPEVAGRPTASTHR